VNGGLIFISESESAVGYLKALSEHLYKGLGTAAKSLGIVCRDSNYSGGSAATDGTVPRRLLR
jgi:hypothetical protein